jgi:hypothetical protein
MGVWSPLGMLNAILGELVVIGLFAGIGGALWLAYFLGIVAPARYQAAREQREEERRAGEWDAARTAELAAWIQEDLFPTPVTRVYPSYAEFNWEWARFRQYGYEMDHDPVVLDDGQLMVTYSLADLAVRDLPHPAQPPRRQVRRRVRGAS